MRGVSSCLKIIARFFSLPDNEIEYKMDSALYIDTTIPNIVIERIRKLKDSMGWTWKGEYSDLYEEEHKTMEILMYDILGASKRVLINSNGDVQNIYSYREL